MTTLWIFGEHEPRTVDVEGESVVTIGRSDSNTICLDDPTVSKRHAKLTKNDQGWWIEDLGSVNGTWMLGERLEKPRRVALGARVKIGAHEFTVDDAELEEDVDESGENSSIFTSIPAIPPSMFSDLAAISEAGDPFNDSEDSSPGLGFDLDRSSAIKESLGERKLRLIREVGEAVIELTEMESVANAILQILVKEIRADRGFVCLLGEEDSGDITLASVGVEAGEKVVFSKSARQEMLTNRAGVMLRPSAGNDDSSLKQMGVVSAICAPLWTKDRIMGFISLDANKASSALSKEHLELLISVSHQAAIGLERARLMETAAKERKHRDYLCQYLDHKIIHSVMNSGEGVDPLAPREQTVTILFCDIVSFTKLSEGMPPTELAAFVHEHLTKMTDLLFDHHGTVDKYIGDAVMALFGAPVADPRAPEYAVRAALAMRDHMKRGPEPKTRMRFGIATGPAIVGNIGSNQRREYTALGDTVNVASRLETFARPNEIIIDETTAESIGDAFELNCVGHIDVKNRMAPVNVYQVGDVNF